MAARPTWKGYLRLSLVACPIRLYPAMTRRDRISFHWLNPKTNNRIEMRAHDADSGDEVARDSLVRGYEFDNGRFVVVDDDEIEALRIESSETIELKRYSARGCAPPRPPLVPTGTAKPTTLPVDSLPPTWHTSAHVFGRETPACWNRLLRYSSSGMR